MIIPDPELKFPLPTLEIPAIKRIYDVIITSQSCDIENSKIDDVILCPHWDLEAAKEMAPGLASQTAVDEIGKGRRPRYMLLNSSAMEIAMGVRIVDLGKVLSLPKPFVAGFAITQPKRLRLISPYRESFAQKFGQFFSRIALPQDIDR